jgi:hypothetical protein
MLLGGCSPRTQVVVRVSADPGVLADSRYHQIHLRVRALLDASDAPYRLDEVVVPLDTTADPVVPLPFDTVLTPEGGDASRRYRVEALAEDVSGVAFVSISAISGYTPGETRVLHLRLSADCRDVFCADELTCRRTRCESAEIAPASLPRLGEAPPDVSTFDGGAAHDAGVPDAQGLDAYDLDAPTPDAPGLDAPGLDALALDAPALEDAVSFDVSLPLDARSAGFVPSVVERTSVGASEAILHGSALCCSHDGSFYAATESLGDHVVLWPASAGSLPETAVHSVGCRPDGHAVMTAILFGSITQFTSSSSMPPWESALFTDPGHVTDDLHGFSLAMSRDHAVIGAPGRAGGGAAVIADAVPSYVQTLQSSDAFRVGDRFGAASAISADRKSVV